MKKLYVFILVCICALSSYAKEFSYDGLTFRVNDDGLTCSVVGSAATSGIVSDVVIPSVAMDDVDEYTVTTIGERAFSTSRQVSYPSIAVENVTIPQTITKIETEAFQGACLKEVLIPNSVRFIADRAFYGCALLENVYVSDTDADYDSMGNSGFIGENAFGGCLSLKTMRLPTSIHMIGDYAFSQCLDLVEIELPKNLVSIGEYAFQRCSSLKAISLPNTITEIKNYAFAPSGLSKVTTFGELPEDVQLSGYLGDGVFVSNESLREVTLPEGITSIGQSAFVGCGNLTKVKLPTKLKSIGVSAFVSCENLTEISLPNSISEIKDGAFIGTKLTHVTTFGEVGDVCEEYGNGIGASAFFGLESLVDMCVPMGITSIGSGAFYGCTNLSNVILPPSLEVIGEHAFHGCSTLSEVHLPETLGFVGEQAFNGCKIKHIKIPDSMTTINQGAFEGAGLESVTIHESVNRIESKALSCGRLFDVTCLAVNPPDCDFDVFAGKENLHVLSSSVEAYRKAIVWRDFFNICGDVSGIDEVSIDEVDRDAIVDIYTPVGVRVYRGIFSEASLMSGECYIIKQNNRIKKIRF